MQQNRLGQQIGYYRLTDILGQGGYATVYRGEHVNLGMKAAIKILNVPDLTAQEKATFLKEARTIANFDHPHIIKILDFNIEQGTIPYMAMPLAKGNLRIRHPEGELVPLDAVLTYTDQLASALDYAHNNNVLHCDIKPANMLIGTAGELLLSDFGIAVVDHKTGFVPQQGTQPDTLKVAGTVEYMAPERFEHKPRRASDQYSLAIVVYEWLAGVRPFEGTYEQVMFKQVTSPPPSLLHKNSTLPKEVEHVLMKALEKAPEKRYGTVQEFAHALRTAAQPSTLRSTARTTPNNIQPIIKTTPSPLVIDEPMITRTAPASANMFSAQNAETLVPALPVAPPVPLPGISNGEAVQHVEEEELDINGTTHNFAAAPSLSPTLEDLPFPDPGVHLPPEIDESSLIDSVSTPARIADPESDKHASPPLPLRRPGRVTPQLEQPPTPLLEPDLEDSPLPPRPARPVRSIASDTLYSSSDLQRLRQHDARREDRAWIKPPRGGSSSASRSRRIDSDGPLAMDQEFARLDHYRWFRNMGMVLNVLSVLALGLLQHSWYVAALSCLSLVLFGVCIRLVNKVSAGIVGIILAGYWGYVGWELAAFVRHLYPVDWFPPLLLVAIAFVLVSGYLHINYITKRLP